MNTRGRNEPGRGIGPETTGKLRDDETNLEPYETTTTQRDDELIEGQHNAQREESGATEEGKEETFNIDQRTFDFRKARSTELPFNIRTNMPGPIENREEEIRLQALKSELRSITDKYAAEKDTEMENLTEEQKRGIKSLKRRQKEGEIVIFQTDKSGKLAADTPENYAEAARPHIEKDEVITEKDYEDIEKLINAHSIFWMRMLRVGEMTGDRERYKRSMKTENSKKIYVIHIQKGPQTM